MSPEDRDVIRQYAGGKFALREEAVLAYRKELRNPSGNRTQDPHMKFMAEVDNEVPDLALRARYRQEVLDV